MDYVDTRKQKSSTSRQWTSPLLAIFVILVSPVLSIARAAEDISGIWLSDRGDGHVEIKSCGSAMCGYIASILDFTIPQNPRDIYNENEMLRARPLCGLQVLGDLKSDGEAWEGWVYDPHPEWGKTFSVEVKLQNANTLKIHGYLGVKLMGETRVWTRDVTNFHKCMPPAK